MKEMEQKNKFTKAKPSPENVAIQTLENCQTFIIMKSRNYGKKKNNTLLKHLPFCGRVMERDGETSVMEPEWAE